MAVCEICGKGSIVVNRVSHANNKTKRRVNSNIHRKRVNIDGIPGRISICTRCLRNLPDLKVSKISSRRVST